MLGSLWRLYRAPFAWALVTAIALLTPAGGFEEAGPDWLGSLLETVPGLDKLGHAGLFLVLAFLLSRSLALSGWRRPVLAGAVAALVYGLLLELAQEAVPGRSPEVLDGVADALGAVVGAILAPTESSHTTGRAVDRPPHGSR